MQEFRFIFLQRLSNGIELLSAVVLLVGFAKGMWAFILYELNEIRSAGEASPDNLAKLRPIVSNYMLLGLDFYIIAVIISTMLHPEWNELLRLATIGLLRTTIGYFLGKVSETTN